MKRPDAAPEPSIEIDVDHKYIVELMDMTEGPSQWADAKEGDISLTWKFRLFDQATGEAVIDNNNGFAYELWQFSNDQTFRNLKKGTAAKAREWAEALIGKGELPDEQIDAIIDSGFAQALVGKRGIADVEWYTTKKGYERLKIIRLRPYRGSSQAAHAPTPEPRDLVGAAAGRPDVGESKAERSARLRRELEESERE